MRKFLLVPVFFTFVFVSCTRDNSTTPDKPVSTDSVQLTRIVDSLFVSGAFSSLGTSKFVYDGAGRLIEWGSFPNSDSAVYTQDYLISRDDQGRALSVVSENHYDNNGGPVSPNYVTEFHYNTSSNQASFYYQYQEGQTPSTGDSTALAYTGENVTDMRRYNISGTVPKDSVSETVWVFDNTGSITSSVAEAQDSSKPIYYAYTFDDKVNPLKLGVEALAFDINRMSADNVLQININWPYGKIFGDDYYVYTYRDDGRPLRCVYTNPATPTLRQVSNYFYSR